MREWKFAVTVIAIGLLLLTVSSVGAERRHGARWWDSAENVKALKLSESEIKQLDEKYEASSLRMIELKSRVEAERFKLQSVMERDDLDEAAIDAQYQRMEEARAVLGKERFAFFVEVRKIIGPQRFHQLMEIYKERRKKRK